MAKNENLSRLDNKIENTAKDLRDNIDKLGGESLKRSELQHYYATKHFVLYTFLAFLVSVCAAYWAIPTYIIDSKNSKLENKLGEILTILKPTTDNKIK